MSQPQETEVTKAAQAKEPKPLWNPSRFRFASNPVLNRAWLRNLLFGLAMALPLSLYGLGVDWWQAKDLVFVYGIVVLTAALLLPIYSAIVRELG